MMSTSFELNRRIDQDTLRLLWFRSNCESTGLPDAAIYVLVVLPGRYLAIRSQQVLQLSFVLSKTCVTGPDLFQNLRVLFWHRSH